MDEFKQTFEVVEECENEEIKRAARTSVALDKLIRNHRLGSMAYYYEGEPGNEYENIVTLVIAGNTLLTGKNIPVAGECGSFSEFYLMDFKDDVVMLVAEGESVPGPILRIGNTNSPYRFSIGAREFMNRWSAQGPSHHCAIGIGYIVHKLAKLGKMLNMRKVKIC